MQSFKCWSSIGCIQMIKLFWSFHWNSWWFPLSRSKTSICNLSIMLNWCIHISRNYPFPLLRNIVIAVLRFLFCYCCSCCCYNWSSMSNSIVIFFKKSVIHCISCYSTTKKILFRFLKLFGAFSTFPWSSAILFSFAFILFSSISWIFKSSSHK